jgi:putative MATE family efflux protein
MASLDISYRGILRMAVPIMFGVFAQSIVMFIDSAFLSRIGATPFEASGNAALLYISMYMVGLGMAEGGQIMIARRIGEGNFVQAGATWRTVFIGLAIMLVVLLVLMLLVLIPNMHLMVNRPDLREQMNDFLSIRALGLVFAVINLAALSILAGSGKTSIMLYSTLAMTVSNIILDYTLIFGKWGMPEMGLEGAAWATVISEAISATVQFMYIMRTGYFKQFRLFVRGWMDRLGVMRLLKISGPLMLQGFLAVAGWTVFFLFIEKMEGHALEVSQVVHKLYFLALIPIIGFNSVTKTYVSNLMSTGSKDVARAVRRILVLNFVFLFLFTHGNLLYPGLLSSLVNDHAYLQDETRQVQYLIMGSILIHGFGGVFINIISGSGATRISFLIEVISLLVYIGYSWLVIIHLKGDVITAWTAEYVYFAVSCLLAALYLSTGRWKKQKA